jgi:hypothetical protein
MEHAMATRKGPMAKAATAVKKVAAKAAKAVGLNGKKTVAKKSSKKK